MENKKIAKLIRLAEMNMNIDPKLLKIKSKQGLKAYIYRITDKLTRGAFKDNDWSNVKKVFEVIDKAGLDINWWVENGGYSPDGTRKTYQFEINFKNEYGTKFNFKGQLICSLFGTLSDPTERYDMIFQIF